jgi:hypothetical protein
MPISDLEIFQTAKLWADRHGDDAILEARKMVTHFQQLGDRDGADVWLRTILALETLRTPQPDRLS